MPILEAALVAIKDQPSTAERVLSWAHSRVGHGKGRQGIQTLMPAVQQCKPPLPRPALSHYDFCSSLRSLLRILLQPLLLLLTYSSRHTNASTNTLTAMQGLV